MAGTPVSLGVEDGADEALDSGVLAAVRHSVRDVLRDMCSSLAVHRHIDGASRLDTVISTQAETLGWTAVGLPECSGGSGLGATGASIVCEELGRVLAPGSLGISMAAQLALADAGAAVTLPGRARLAPLAVAAELHDGGDLSMAADGVSGETLLIGGERSGLALVTVMRGPDPIMAVVDLGGLETTQAPGWDLTRTLTVARMTKAPVLAVLDDDTQAAVMAHLALAVAADSLGVMRAAFEMTLNYLKTREQFGRPIGGFQALKHRAVDLALLIEKGGNLVTQAAGALDTKSPGTELWALLAKAEVCDAAIALTADCIQLHGGIGYTWEHDCHLFLKRARLNAALFESSAACRDRAAMLLAEVVSSGGTALEMPTS